MCCSAGWLPGTAGLYLQAQQQVPTGKQEANGDGPTSPLSTTCYVKTDSCQQHADKHTMKAEIACELETKAVMILQHTSGIHAGARVPSNKH